MRRRLGWLAAVRVLAVTLLVVVLVMMATSQDEPDAQLGPFPTGDGDAVSVAPRAAP